MRFFFFGPRVLGIRPGISLSPRDFKKLAYPSGTPSKTDNITGGFVYVIADEHGRHKIGSSIDPIQRIAQLQTGSAGKLDFAFIGVSPEGAYTRIERYAHTILEAQKMPNGGDEWFNVPASIAIGAVHEAAMRLGDPIQQVQPMMVPQILAAAALEARQTGGKGSTMNWGILGGLPAFIRWPLSITIGVIAAAFFVLAFELLSTVANLTNG